MTFLTLLLNGIQWADKAVENLDFLDVFAIDLFRFGYQNLVDQLDKIQDFIDEVSKYAGITELNYKILHQLIDKILVSKAEKVDGEYVQKIQIFYRFIGPLDAIE